MKIPLHDYQIYAKNWMLNHPYCGLFLKMGLGKTSIVLEALWELNPSCHVLVIAPKTIARCTWVNEIEKWNIPLRTQSLIVNERGKQLTKKQRDEIYDKIPSSPPTVYFINREMVTNLYKRFPGNKWCFPIVIIDESQSFKSYNSSRFKTMKNIRPWLYRLVELTGSPTPKGLMDLWSQIWLLDMGERLGKNITQYRDTYFNPGRVKVNNYPVTWDLKYGAENTIYRKISDLVISMKNDNIKLPPITFNDAFVELEYDEYQLYKTFMNKYVLNIDENTQIEAANAAVLSNKLSQMASGAIYTYQAEETTTDNTDTAAQINLLLNNNQNNDTKKDKHEFATIHEHKLEMCEYIINNTTGCVIVAYKFISDKEMLMNYFNLHGIEAVVFDGSPEMERAWNQKKYPVMLIQPASCGFGLNLQEGGETLIWYTLPWSLEQYEQTNARIYRQGQKNPVVIHHIMTKKTIDTKILNALKTKDLSQQKLIEAIKASV